MLNMTALRYPFRIFRTLAIVFSVFSTLFFATAASGATLTVDGSNCTLAEAITSVNNAASEPGCSETGTYGTNDRITIPAGTQVLTANLPLITVPVTIEGAGMNTTVIDGDGQYAGFHAVDASQLTIKKLKITAFSSTGISSQRTSVDLSEINVDGENANYSSDLSGIIIQNIGSNSINIATSNIYVHNFTTAGEYFHAFIIEQSNGGTINATVLNTTVSDIHGVGSAGINGFMTSIGLYGGTGTGTINATIINTTVHDVTSQDLTAPFNSFAWANDPGGGTTATITTHIHNLTITGIRGVTGANGSTVGLESAAFFAAGAAAYGNIADVVVNVDNSLIADNLNEVTSSNCSEADLSGLFGGTGTVNTNIVSQGHNLSDDASCVSFAQPGDQQNVGNIISTLGPLQDNGGFVPTRALLPGSPAIGSGVYVLGISVDARGIARPASNPDIGAFQTVYTSSETQSLSPIDGGNLPETGQSTSEIILFSCALIFFGGLLVGVFRHRRIKIHH